jgi:glycosyltransferase involved in cell wall biosynthesis
VCEKKILFVTHLFYPARGGVEIHIKRLSQGLSKKGYQVKVLTSNAYSTEAFFLKDKRRIEKTYEVIDGVEIERLDFRTFGKSALNLMRALACRIKYPLNEWVRFFSFGPRNPHFLKKIMQFQPDLIYAAPLPTLNVHYAYRAAKKLNVPLVVIPSYHIHDPCSFFNSIYFKIMRESDLIMAQSTVEKEFLAKEGNIDSNKIVTFPPLPFDEKDLTADEEKLSKEKTKKRYGIKQHYTVLYLGQHGIHKHISQVIKAMEKVWQYFDDVSLVIAGGTTEHTTYLKKMAAEYTQKYGQKIYFLDNFLQEEKNKIYNMADIFISLSEFESFGIVFAEAMLHRVPVIASVFSVARSIVEDFQTGLLVNPHCEVEVSGAILELLLDDDIRRVYGENGRKKALKEYHPAWVLDQWHKIIDSLLNH